jgi:hypothetical protein
LEYVLATSDLLRHLDYPIVGLLLKRTQFAKRLNETMKAIGLTLNCVKEAFIARRIQPNF